MLYDVVHGSAAEALLDVEKRLISQHGIEITMADRLLSTHADAPGLTEP